MNNSKTMKTAAGAQGMRMPLLQMVSRSMFGRLDMDELNRQIDGCSGFVKMVCGVANNAAVMVARASCDEVRGRGHTNRPHPRYRFDVRRQFQRFFDSWHEYEMRLLYPPYNKTRFFHVADMPEATRKIYGKMTDVQYFDFWKGTGVLAYQRSEVMLNSLHNKFRLSLEHHDVPYAQQVAWVMVAQSALELAVEIWNMAMRSCREVLPKEVSQKVIDDLWRDFSVRPQADEWYRAMMMLAPEINSYDLDNIEDRNIQLGLEQLRDIWISPDLPFDSTINAVKDFDRDIFRTRGEAKKAIRQLTEERNGAMGKIKISTE